jgi:hypothetical protein
LNDPAARGVDGGASPDALRHRCVQFARAAGRDGCALYETVSRAVADDDDLLALLGVAPPDQQRPNLLLAAVHYLLLGGTDHPLARYYPTVAEYRGLAVAPAGNGSRTTGPVEAFRDFCARHRAALATLVATRATQTNEIGRCTGLLPGLATVARRSGRPLALLDLGTSAGLNLLFDRYRYDYADGAPTGDPSSAVVLPCQLRGDRVPPLRAPAVVSRTGIDLRPIDATDPLAARWLLACQWPHDLARFRRQRAALHLASQLPAAQRPAVQTGDLLDALPALVAVAPPGAAVCVVHSWVAAYLTAAEQATLADTVRALSHHRPVYWLFAESPAEVPGLPVPPAPAGHEDRAATALVLVEADGGHENRHRLADMHHHGTWLRWWGAAA